MIRPRTLSLVLAGAVLYAAAAWVHYQYFWRFASPPEGRAIVEDREGILAERAAFIQRYHAELLRDHDIDYRVLVVGGEARRDINHVTHEYFSQSETGGLSSSGRGLLLVVDAGSDLVRLEVSRALEGIYTDGFVSYVQHRQMVPFFRTGRIADGILASTELIFDRAQDAELERAFSPPLEAASGGAGAVNRAQIGDGGGREFRAGPDVSLPNGDPREVLAAYGNAMDQRNGNADLSIYTRDTREFLSRWTLTAAQMDNEADNLRRCQAGELKVSASRGVIRHPAASRHCPPYFFRVEDGAWRLDLVMMSRLVRFNHRNQWHFSADFEALGEPYAFAFVDWRLDRHGFPHCDACGSSGGSAAEVKQPTQ